MSFNTYVKRILAAGVVFCVGLSGAPSARADTAGTVTGSKVVTTGDIACGGETTVTISLDATAGIAGEPEDIMLVLDHSGSMHGLPLADLKIAANSFVDLLDKTTDGVLDGVIGYGTRVGVVSFSTDASVDVPLTSDANAVKAAINALVSTDLTNHQAAISLAQSELAGSEPTHSKDMIIMTDGQTTIGGNGQPEAAAARAAGTEIFTIGLGSVDVAQLNGWATDPDAQHVFITPNSADLRQIFELIGAAIIAPAATNVVVTDVVDPWFSASGVVASKGTPFQVGNTITWQINQLFTEHVELSYTITHDGIQGGAIEVNDSITYVDDEGKTVSFPSPSVNVRGCAAKIALTPDFATNELGPGQSHDVTATVLDDFDAPVPGVTVDFDIVSGPNAAKSGSGATDASGAAPFSYLAEQGLAGLGLDEIVGCFTRPDGVPICDTAHKEWVDTTPPEVQCTPTTNPAGNNVPPAGDNPRAGQNPDGFYLLTATDVVDPDPIISVADSGSSFVAGPFADGDRVKITQAPHGEPAQKPMSGVILAHITLNGEAVVTATDASGNTATVTCKVPPPPK